MSASADSTTIGFTAGGLLLAYFLWQTSRSSKLPLPPSPRSYPLIGNALSMPAKHEHLGFMKLGEQLGSDIISLSMFGTVVIVLSKPEDAINLFEKRSSIYSDRPRFPVMTEPSLMDWGAAVTAMRYGDRWKQVRRLIHRWLHKQAAEAFQLSQQQQARLLLKDLLSKSKSLDSSEELEVDLCGAVSGTLMDSLYGHGVRDANDQFITKARQAFDAGAASVLPSNYLANVFPALVHVPDWFPGTSWKRIASGWREPIREAVNGPFNWTKSQMTNPAHDPSIVESMLGQAEELGMNKDEADEYVKHTAIILFGAGMDTSVSTMLWFFTAMVLHPDIQQRAQEEIDLVVGKDRLPEMEDRDQLPYVARLIKEVERWRPVAPLGLPHVCQQDDEYKGYRIPKDAVVFANIWAIGRGKLYANPDTFDPDRFLDQSLPPSPIFGFGRRICPGMHYAESTLFIFITSILATFKIHTAQDKDGKDIIPTAEGDNSIVVHPIPFKLKLSPRSVLHEKLVLNEI